MSNSDAAEIARLKAAAAEAKAAAAKAAAEAAQAKLEAALAAAGEGKAEEAPAEDTSEEPAEEPVEEAATGAADATGVAGAAGAEMSEFAAEIARGYEFAGTRLPIGVVLDNGEPVPGADISLPMGMLNRHGLIAGATGTGKTRTLQLMAEGLSKAGVPVFVTDVKGDLTGLAEPGELSDGLAKRNAKLGQDWQATGFPMEMLSLAGDGKEVPIRTSVTDFGPLLLAKVLELNDTQESALSLIFSWADKQGLALIDLQDLRDTISYLTSDEGKGELREIGGIATSTAGVILREVAALQAQGADDFFGEPAFLTSDLMRTTADGKGIISCLEVPDLLKKPALISTFIMWLLADLFSELPEVGDADKPRLVFFFDEAHLLFNGASSAFLDQVVQTVRLIRSKGVGVIFITQSPTDIPAEVLAQLGARVQHALRAYTAKDQKNLKAAAQTYPNTDFDLPEMLTSLGTGEAVVTVLDDKGRPSPVAPTKVYAPAANMGPAAAASISQVLASSQLMAKYETPIDPHSASEMLLERIEEQRRQAQLAAEAEQFAKEQAQAEEKARKEREKELARLEREERKARERAERQAEQEAQRNKRRRQSTFDSVIRSAGRTLGREITRSIFGTRRR